MPYNRHASRKELAELLPHRWKKIQRLDTTILWYQSLQRKYIGLEPNTCSLSNTYEKPLLEFFLLKNLEKFRFCCIFAGRACELELRLGIGNLFPLLSACINFAVQTLKQEVRNRHKLPNQTTR